MKPSFQIQRLTRLLHQKPSLQFSPQLLFQLHSQLITTGLHSRHPFSLLSLLELYYSNPSTFSHATTLFRHIPEPYTTLKWSVAIRSHASSSNPLKALSLFQELLHLSNYESPVDDPFVFASVIKACNRLEAFRDGKSVHCHVVRLGLDGNVYVLNSLVRFYLGFVNGMKYACQLFDKIPEKNVVSVNCMVSGWIKRGNFDVGLSLFIEMLKGSFGFSMGPNCYTFVILISGCVEYGRVEVGKSLHAYCWRLGFTWNIEICNVLIDLYAKFNCVCDAERMFREMTEKDLFSWNTMLSGYAKNNFTEKAFILFKEMKDHKLGADGVSFTNLLVVAANIGDLSLGRMVHGHLGVSGIEIGGTSIGNALINMYLKCGDMETARRVFDDLSDKNIVAWNSMIHGYVECGTGTEAITLFEDMQSKGLKADEVTVLGLILACRDSKNLDKCIELHSLVESSGYLNNSIVLHNALIDTYAKCGSMVRAKVVFAKMPCRDVVSWTTMIMGFALNGKGEESLATFHRMLDEKIEPDAITFAGVLFGCDQAGLADEAQRLYNVMHKEYHIEPQIVHCEFVVDMLARAGRIEEAYQFVRAMPVEPNEAIWRMLISACNLYKNDRNRSRLDDGFIELNFCQS